MSWTLDELVRRAGEVLAAQHVRAPNGRVTALPDRRIVRWYSTIGLVDRPEAYRGRTALYGPRHLLQVIAVKRRQAQGRSLTAIQAELAGATDAALRAVAQLPDEYEPSCPAASHPDAAPQGAGRDAAQQRFWARPAPAPIPDPASDSASEEMEVSYTVALHPRVRLILSARPNAGDLTEIQAAARPLLDLLSQRGLLNEGD